MRGKRGDLVKNVLGILLTVIGLAVFFIGLSKLYNAHVNQESENAKHTMEVIMKKIEALPTNGDTQVVLQGFPGAENWYLVGWSKNSADRPNKCFFNSCLCLCKGTSSALCQESGFCRKLPGDLNPTITHATYSCTTQFSLALAYNYNPHFGPNSGVNSVRKINGNVLDPDISQDYDYKFPNNVVIYRRTLASSNFELRPNLFDFGVSRTNSAIVIGSGSDNFLGEVEGREFTSRELTECSSSHGYKAVFKVQNSFKDKLILLPEVYQKKYGFSEGVSFDFIDG